MLETNAIPPAEARFPLEMVRRIASVQKDAVRLSVHDAVAQLGSGGQIVSGTGFGASAMLMLSRPALRLVADAAVGRELVCDIRGSDEALTWRAPDQPDFVALMMPSS